jgi:acyl-CoA thioester hydrolase
MFATLPSRQGFSLSAATNAYQISLDLKAPSALRGTFVEGKPDMLFVPPIHGAKPLSYPSAGLISVRVYYEDTDFSGRVYHASYLRFLERGRTEWMRERGFAHRDFAEDSGVFFAVRSLQIDYLAPAVMDDLIRVETGVSALRGASIEFRQRIVRDDKELVTAAVLVAVIRDGRPARIPASLRRLVAASS